MLTPELPGQPDTGAAERPLLLYLNVPFCAAKCHFCVWVADVPRADLRLRPTETARDRYVQAVVEQVQAHAPVFRTRGYRPRLMYWGGGTASILTPGEIGAIHDAITAGFDLSGVTEATIEGSPESMGAEKLRLFRDRGFNRVSLGVQTFDDARLRQIGRVHDSAEAVSAIRAAAEVGFDNINIDLMVGFPGQGSAEIEQSVRTALSLPVNHLSVYVYYPIPGTVLRRQVERGESTLDIRAQLEQYGLVRDMLEAAGMPEYGTSYFGAPRCAADQAYYQLQMEWLGLGSGAQSLVNRRVLANERGGLHTFNQRPAAFDTVKAASSPSVVVRFLHQALGTAEGMDAGRFEERTGISLPEAVELPEVRDYLDRLAGYGRIEMDGTGIRVATAEDRVTAQTMVFSGAAPADAEFGVRSA